MTVLPLPQNGSETDSPDALAFGSGRRMHSTGHRLSRTGAVSTAPPMPIGQSIAWSCAPCQ